MTFRDLLSESGVVVVAGSGGVGKTSSAAAVAIGAATQLDRKVLVMTIDPARRLADSLGLDSVGNHPVEVDLTRVAATSNGRLHAVMLDTKQSWDELVSRHAPDAKTSEKIFRNPLYRSITERFVQSHDYIAMERLYSFHKEGDFDLIVIDTPPAAHAVDFLEAPSRMADFFDSKLLKFLVAPSRSTWMSVTSKPFLQIADRLLGRNLLEEMSEFFTLLESMRPGFIERAMEVQRLLAAETTSFVTVTTLEPAPRAEAMALMEELARRGLHSRGLVLNRLLPSYLTSVSAIDAARSVGHDSAETARRVGETSVALKGKEELVEQVLNELSANFDRFASLARHENEQRRGLESASLAVAAVPWFESDLHDVEGLLRLSEKIWQ